mmetsp:Transcript_46138/g.96887  ORF Transcript_46138/g.96887 Transcript_46138/m.96887 type:complete len:280 (-) Transcript_46138:280-1119(-)
MFFTNSLISAKSRSTITSSNSLALAIMENFSSSSPSYRRSSSMSLMTVSVALDPSGRPTDLAIMSLICGGSFSKPEMASSRLSSLNSGFSPSNICCARFFSPVGSVSSIVLESSTEVDEPVDDDDDSVFPKVAAPNAAAACCCDCGISLFLNILASDRRWSRSSSSDIISSSLSIFANVSDRSIFSASRRVFSASARSMAASDSAVVSFVTGGCCFSSTATSFSPSFLSEGDEAALSDSSFLGLSFRIALAKNGIRESFSSSSFSFESDSTMGTEAVRT